MFDQLQLCHFAQELLHLVLETPHDSFEKENRSLVGNNYSVVMCSIHQPSMQDHCKTISIGDLLTYQSILCTLWLLFSHALTKRPDSTSKPHDLWRFLGARTESQPVLDPAMAEHCHQEIIDITGRCGRVNIGLRIDSQKYLFLAFLRKSLLNHPLSGATVTSDSSDPVHPASVNIWMTRFTMVSTFFWSSPFSNFTSSIRSLRSSQAIPGPMPKCGLVVADG